MDDQGLQEKLLAAFQTEAVEHVKTLAHGTHLIETGSANQENLQEMFRAAHSLKGASRAVGKLEIQTLCQSTEDLFDALRKGTVDSCKEVADTLYETVEALENLLKEELISTEELIDKLSSFLTEKKEKVDPAPPLIKEVEDPVPAKPKPKPKKPSPSLEEDRTIRVGADRIDKLLQHAEEMLMIKLSADQRMRDLKLIGNNIKEWEKEVRKLKSAQWNVELHSVEDLLNQISLFIETQDDQLKGIKGGLNKLLNHLEQDRRVVASMVDSVIDDTKDILMQPLDSLLESFPRAVRDLCKVTGKECLLKIEGDEIEVDRRILEKLKDPLLHILRNAIDHGIEAPKEREGKGKPAVGTLKITAKQLNTNTFELVISDDGKGIDPNDVRETAIRKGWAHESDLMKMSDKALIELLFEPGASTASIVTELSGRGIGLDVVRKNVEKLAGEVSIETEKGKGSSITLTIPLTLSTFRGILIKVSGEHFVLPTHNVVRVLKLHREDLRNVENRTLVHTDGRSYAYIPLANVLGLPLNEDGVFHILLVKSSHDIIAFGVDQIDHEQDIFVKALGKQLENLKQFSGATILDWGKVVLILDPFGLIQSTKHSTSFETISKAEVEEKTAAKRILVAEDSITSRLLLKNILESAGFKVKAVIDGMEAFSTLTNEPFDMVLSDVEMPRMNGFDLVRKIRSSEAHKDVPIILCTSRGSKEDREEGIQAGANAYIDKSSFTQSSLLEIMRQLL